MNDTSTQQKDKLQQTEKFVEPLAKPDQPLNISSTILPCKVIGLQPATKQLCCVSCSKKVMKLEDSSLVQCTSCKLIQTPDSCKTQWYLCIMVTHNYVNYPMKKKLP